MDPTFKWSFGVLRWPPIRSTDSIQLVVWKWCTVGNCTAVENETFCPSFENSFCFSQLKWNGSTSATVGFFIRLQFWITSRLQRVNYPVGFLATKGFLQFWATLFGPHSFIDLPMDIFGPNFKRQAWMRSIDRNGVLVSPWHHVLSVGSVLVVGWISNVVVHRFTFPSQISTACFAFSLNTW